MHADPATALGRHGQHVAVWLVVFLLVGVGVVRYETFAGIFNVATFLNINAVFVLLAVGMTPVIMTGRLDLSVGAVAAISAVVTAHLSPHGLVVALPGAALAGIAFGTVNAAAVLKLRVPSFAATLATLLVARATIWLITSHQDVAVDWAGGVTGLAANRAFGVVPWTFVLAMVVALVAWVVPKSTADTRRTIVFVYVFSGLCAGLAGAVSAAVFGAGQPTAGLGWELTAITAVLLGGTLLTGGRGSIPATVAGALLIGLVFNLLNFENGGLFTISGRWQPVIQVGLLAVALLLQRPRLRRNRLA